MGQKSLNSGEISKQLRVLTQSKLNKCEVADKGDEISGLQGQFVTIPDLEASIWRIPLELIFLNPACTLPHFSRKNLEQLQDIFRSQGQKDFLRVAPYLHKKSGNIRLLLRERVEEFLVMKSIPVVTLKAEIVSLVDSSRSAIHKITNLPKPANDTADVSLPLPSLDAPDPVITPRWGPGTVFSSKRPRSIPTNVVPIFEYTHKTLEGKTMWVRNGINLPNYYKPLCGEKVIIIDKNDPVYEEFSKVLNPSTHDVIVFVINKNYISKVHRILLLDSEPELMKDKTKSLSGPLYPRLEEIVKDSSATTSESVEVKTTTDILHPTMLPPPLPEVMPASSSPRIYSRTVPTFTLDQKMKTEGFSGQKRSIQTLNLPDVYRHLAGEEVFVLNLDDRRYSRLAQKLQLSMNEVIVVLINKNYLVSKVLRKFLLPVKSLPVVKDQKYELISLNDDTVFGKSLRGRIRRYCKENRRYKLPSDEEFGVLRDQEIVIIPVGDLQYSLLKEQVKCGEGEAVIALVHEKNSISKIREDTVKEFPVPAPRKIIITG